MKEALPQEVAGTSDVTKKTTESGLEMASYFPRTNSPWGSPIRSVTRETSPIAVALVYSKSDSGSNLDFIRGE